MAACLSREVVHDEFAGISVLLTVQYEEAPVKRARPQPSANNTSRPVGSASGEV